MKPKRTKNNQRFTLPKILLRFVPFLIALSILSSSLSAYPQSALNLYQKILTQIGFSTQPSQPQNLTSSQIIQEINSVRQKNNLASLSIQENLNQAANLISLDIIQKQSLDNPLEATQAATAYQYHYQQIISLIGFLPTPLIPTLTTSIIKKHPDIINNSDLVHLGISQLSAQINNTDGLIYTILFTEPEKEAKILKTKPKTKTYISTLAPAFAPSSYYTGVELWQAVQKYRQDHGVPEFKQDNILCTIASIRVNQLIDLDRLDDHDGFSPLVDKYKESGQLTHHDVAENILSGFPTAQEAINGWDSSLGHQSLMQDGSFIYGCAAANYGFAVLIAAY